jgi:hypothetical protein
VTEESPQLDDRPWERPGAVRRDCEPHRGDLLFFLGRLSIGPSCLSMWLVPLAVIGLPLGLAVLWLSARDLRQMCAGHMDPAGKGLVSAARRNAAWATGIPVFAALTWSWMVLWSSTDRPVLVPLGFLTLIGSALVMAAPWRARRPRD